MELRRYLLLFRQRIVLIIVTVVAGVAGGYLVTNNAPIYKAQTSIYVTSREPASQADTNDVQLDRIIATYTAMVTSSPVAQGALQASHAPRSVGQVISETTATVVTNTNLISISVDDGDPAVAQSLANGVAASFIAQVQNLSDTPGANASSSPAVSVFQQASLPTASLPTSLKRDVGLGALFGLIVSAGVVLLVEYLDISFKSAEDLELLSGLPVLGTIPLGHPGTVPLATAT
jgi:capsular polysaccharide biosynthesis protein